MFNLEFVVVLPVLESAFGVVGCHVRDTLEEFGENGRNVRNEVATIMKHCVETNVDEIFSCLGGKVQFKVVIGEFLEWIARTHNHPRKYLWIRLERNRGVFDRDGGLGHVAHFIEINKVKRT